MVRLSKRKILFLLHLPPPIHGSSMVGSYIKQSKTINNTYETSYVNLLASKDVSETGKLKLVKFVNFFKTILVIFKQLIKFKPDLCYFALSTTGFAFYKDILLVILLKMFNVKIIYHLHNKGVKNYTNNRFYKKLYSFVFQNTEVIILSKRLYSDIEMFVLEEHIYICQNGIPKLKEFFTVSKKVYSEAPVKLLFLSNLIESKGVGVLLEACKMLKNKNIPFVCNFVGGEGDISKEQFEKYVKIKGLENRVYYLGKKYDADKYDILADSDIFVFPTFYSNECFPLVILEAMQHHLPVVSTCEGGIPDMVDDGGTGFIVKQKDVLALTNRLETLIFDDTLRFNMGNAGYTKYKKNFTINIFEQLFKNILMEVLMKKEE